MAELDLPELHSRALADTGLIVDAIKPDDLSLPTPCPDWDVAALLQHVIAGNLWAAELGAGATIEQVGSRLDGDVVGSDPSASYRDSARVAEAVFRAPGAMDAMCAVSYGPVPGAVYAGHRFIDVLVHGWDLATATGQDTTLDPDLAAAALAVVEPQADLLVASGAFAAPHGDPPDQSAQSRLLHLLGRTG